MKRRRKAIVAFAIISILLNICSSTAAQNFTDVSHAPEAVESSIQATVEYTSGTVKINEMSTPCIVKNEVNVTASETPGTYFVTHHSTLYIPLTEEQRANTAIILSQMENGNPTVLSTTAPPHMMDPWYECEYHIETVAEYETRYNVSIAPGEYDTITYVGITGVRFGYYTYEYGEGKVSLRNAKVEVLQAGYVGDIPTSDFFEDTWVADPPNDNYHCGGLDDLIYCATPSNWPKIAMTAAGWAFATFSGTAVNNYGDTYEILVQSNIINGYG